MAVLRRQRSGRIQLFCTDRLLWMWLYRIWPRALYAVAGEADKRCVCRRRHSCWFGDRIASRWRRWSRWYSSHEQKQSPSALLRIALLPQSGL